MAPSGPFIQSKVIFSCQAAKVLLNRVGAEPELLNPVVSELSDVNIALAREGNPPRAAELALTRAMLSPLGEKATVIVEHLDASILVVGDIETTIGVQAEHTDTMELAGVASRLAPPG